jgi:GrpB-like predicted nucleotidyltransferase (UPF0157 family)
VKTKRVIVVPYDKQWVSEFEKIKKEISDVLGTVAICIEHVGSTSVVGLWAKPIIDIDVVIKDETVLSTAIQKLESIGYHYRGNLGIEGRYAFGYEIKPDLILHHLYVCPQNSKELNRHICFRDYLRNHPEAIEKYSEIKRNAACLFPNDMDGYIGYKNAFIEEIYAICGL